MLETLFLPPLEPGRPTIVLLHEALGSVSHWRDFPQQLARATGLGVFAYSRQGHGQSPALTPGPRGLRYLHHEAETILPKVLADAEIDRPILFGHSDGAAIALLYAAAFPANPRALVLAAPHVFVEDVTIAAIRQVQAAHATTDLPARLARHHANADALFASWIETWLDPPFRAWNIEASLPAIQCPLLALHGRDDEYFTVAQVHSLRQHIPHAESLILASCGHSPHRQQPEVTLSATAHFVTSRLGL